MDADFCPLCQSLAAQNRELDQLDSKAREQAEKDPRRRLPSDGRQTYIRQLTEAEIEERRERARAAREASDGSA